MQLGPHLPLHVSREETPTFDRTSENAVEELVNFETLMQPLQKDRNSKLGSEISLDLPTQIELSPVPSETGEVMRGDENTGLIGVESSLETQLKKVSSVKDISTLVPSSNAGLPKQFTDFENEAALRSVSEGSDANPSPIITQYEETISGMTMPKHELALRSSGVPSDNPAHNGKSANLIGGSHSGNVETARLPSQSGDALDQSNGLRSVRNQLASEAPDLHKTSFPISPKKNVLPQFAESELPSANPWTAGTDSKGETRREGAAAQAPVHVAGDVWPITRTGDFSPPGIPMISATGTESSGFMTPNLLSVSEASQAVDALVELVSSEFSTAEARSARADIPVNLRAELPRYIALQLVDVAKPMPDRPVELTLTPEELGRLRLTFTGDFSTMAVTVNVERPETLELMKRHIEILAQEMREIGYEGVSFSFEQSDAGAHDGRAEQEEGSRNDPQSGAQVPPGFLSDAPRLLQVNLSNAIDGIDIRL